MKAILMLCVAFVITASASAQRNSRHKYPRPRTQTSVSIGIGGGYSPYHSPFYSRTTRLDNEIANIRADYNDRIWYARHDKSFSKSERKAEIRRLKSERDRAIRDAQYSYYRRR